MQIKLWLYIIYNKKIEYKIKFIYSNVPSNIFINWTPKSKNPLLLQYGQF